MRGESTETPYDLLALLDTRPSQATVILNSMTLPVLLQRDDLWINYTGSPYHTGNAANAVDLNRLGGRTLNFDLGQPVVAPADGRVVAATESEGGSLVILEHESLLSGQVVRWYTIYEHLQNITAGLLHQRIQAGDQFGEVGAVGTNTAHLHFEVRIESLDAPSVDLTGWLQDRWGIGTAASPLGYREVGGGVDGIIDQLKQEQVRQMFLDSQTWYQGQVRAPELRGLDETTVVDKLVLGLWALRYDVSVVKAASVLLDLNEAKLRQALNKGAGAVEAVAHRRWVRLCVV